MSPVVASTPLWPLVAYFGGILLVVAAMLGGSALLGEHHQERATGEPYEGGMLPTGSARLRIAAPFYLVAMFFLLFDLEAVYLFAWAVAARESGWRGYFEALIFVGVLGIALAYLWRLGALDWGSLKANARADEPLGRGQLLGLPQRASPRVE